MIPQTTLSGRLIESNIISSQMTIQNWVVLCLRLHPGLIKNIIFIVESALSKSGKSINDLDAIAYTSCLITGSLLVGSTFAKSLGYVRVILIAVNHLKACTFPYNK